MSERSPAGEWLGPRLEVFPRRIVSLCPSITETLFALGAGNRLAGCTRFCIHPADDVALVPKFGGTKDPDVAAILALGPDLVFVNREENRRPDAEALAKHVPVHVSHPCSPVDVPPFLRELGSILGIEERSEPLARSIERGIFELQTLAARWRPFRFAYLVWRGPWMAAGRGTYIDGLASLAGAVNVFDRERGDYPATTPAELADLRPDVVFLPSEPFPFEEKHAAELRGAGVIAEMRLVDGDDWCWHGVRTLRGLEAASKFLATRSEGSAAL